MPRLPRRMVFLTLASALAVPAGAQRNPRGTAKLDLNGKVVVVEYGRPSLRGRTVEQMLSRLGADGVWRLGADQATTFSASQDLKFGGAVISKGEYSLWAKKQADDSWTLIFNKQHGQWGVNSDGLADRNPNLDVVAVPLMKSKATSAVGQVTITLERAENGAAICIAWGDMKLSANFE
jgi:hypothetical protein